MLADVRVRADPQHAVTVTIIGADVDGGADTVFPVLRYADASSDDFADSSSDTSRNRNGHAGDERDDDADARPRNERAVADAGAHAIADTNRGSLGTEPWSCRCRTLRFNGDDRIGGVDLASLSQLIERVRCTLRHRRPTP